MVRTIEVAVMLILAWVTYWLACEALVWHRTRDQRERASYDMRVASARRARRQIKRLGLKS